MDGALAAVLVVGIVALSRVVSVGPWGDIAWGLDARAYWGVDRFHPYGLEMGDIGAFLYTPPVAQVFAVLGLLPWELFLVGWTALLTGVLVALVPGRAVAMLIIPIVALEILYGNVHLLIAASLVLGFRWPAAWVLPLLLKVTPGVGLAWFVARRDWRSLAVALGITSGIAVSSFVIAPTMWPEWIARVTASASQEPTWLGSIFGPLWVRVAAAIAVAYLGGLVGWRSSVALAVAIAIPQLWIISPSVLVALIPLVAMDRRDPLPAMVSRPAWSWRTASPAPRS